MMRPNDADGMANSVDSAETSLNWFYAVRSDLPVPTCTILTLRKVKAHINVSTGA